MSDLKREGFENYLERVCFEEYPEILDDDRPDFFDTWLTELSVADYLRYGDECVEGGIVQAIKKTRADDKERVKLIIVKYFEKGLGFNKGSINDSLFQELKMKLLSPLKK